MAGRGDGTRRRAGVVTFDDVLDQPGLAGPLKDPAEVDQAGARVGEAAVRVEVLDVHLLDPAAVPADQIDRVGRAPLRKLSRRERFVGPAAELAERGLDRSALIRAVRATLDFDVPADEESVELQRLLAEEEPSGVVVQVTGVEPGHPVFDELLAAVTDRQRR